MSLGFRLCLGALAASLVFSAPVQSKTRSGCSLTVLSPQDAPAHKYRGAGWMRCARTAHRYVDLGEYFQLASGKDLALHGQGVEGTFKAHRRVGFDYTAPCENFIRNDRRVRRRYKDDLPVKFFTRLTVSGRNGRELQRKDSHAVPLAELCPEYKPGAQPASDAG